MSLYTVCGEAARQLLDDWSLRRITTGLDGIFTEHDVIILAARSERFGFSKEEMRDAAREASQVLGLLFRNRDAVRYGPVQIPGFEEPDYARFEGKIVYASPEGPPALVTPNGMWKRMTVADDFITRPGRRLGTNRNDLIPWMEQEILRPTDNKPNTAEQREILRLKAEVEALMGDKERLETEVHRLRERSATLVTRAEVEDLISKPKRRKTRSTRAV